jgi:multisubunit Na+/H+ antiporter MnhF subunit
MSEHAPDRVWSGIDIPKTIAGVLAAVSAAVVGSFLGVAGTLAGAAIASVVGSIGTEVYRKFIDRGQKKIVATFVTAPAAVGTPAVAAAADETPSQPEPVAPDETAQAAPTPARKMRWGRVAMVATSVFVLAIGVLTAFELITGKTAADAVTGHNSGSTSTVGSVLNLNKKSDNQDTKPATTPSSGTPSEAPATSGTDAPATTEPTAPATDTTTPGAPSTETATPEPTATDTQNSGGGDGSQNDSGQNNGGQNDIAPPPTAQQQGTE